ncbi:MAG: DUF2868 domain-containing protein [Gammaproteobacteria bacterium]|nr:DUF2868 domain-containing protein [Gammaproteobacteria bacterium]
MAFDDRPKAAQIARLLVALNRDEAGDRAGRSARDEAFKATLPSALTPWARIRRWLEHVDAGGECVTRQTESALAATSVALFALGAVSGWLALLAAFYYDGSARVNVLAVLGALLGLPLLSLLLSWTGAAASKLSALSGLASLLARPAAGKLGLHLRRWLHAEGRAGLDALLGLDGHDRSGVARVRYWLLVFWSHIFASAFFLAALVTALALIFFSDLAFGWSTTLNLSASSVHEAAAVAARPWLWLLPEAVPTLELVQATRYFRLTTDAVTAQEAALYGQWWPFLLCMFCCYGLVPRVLSGVVAARCLSRALAALMAEHAGIRALAERLVERESSSRPAAFEPSGTPAAYRNPAPAEVEQPAVHHWPPLRAGGPVVNWNGVPVSDGTLSRWLRAERVHHAGAGISVAAEAELAKALQPANGVVTLCCKSWEPPLLELQDFIAAVAACYPKARIQVLPARVENGEPAPPRARDREVWQRAMAAVDVALVGLRQWAADR